MKERTRPSTCVISRTSLCNTEYCGLFESQYEKSVEAITSNNKQKLRNERQMRRTDVIANFPVHVLGHGDAVIAFLRLVIIRMGNNVDVDEERTVLPSTVHVGDPGTP